MSENENFSNDDKNNDDLSILKDVPDSKKSSSMAKKSHDVNDESELPKISFSKSANNEVKTSDNVKERPNNARKSSSQSNGVRKLSNESLEKRPQVDRNKKVNSSQKRNASKSKLSSSLEDKKEVAKKNQKNIGEKSSNINKRKKRWSVKKKICVTLGFIFVIGCIILLILWLILNYYASMIQKEDGTINPNRPQYSDVDPTKEDTLDMEAEEAKLKEILANNSSGLLNNQDVFNVLLVGEDIRDTALEERGNTDVMMLISINKKDKTFTMTSFMRDIYLYLPDAGYYDRLNAAYSYGGAASLSNTLEQYFGVQIDKYVIVNFYSFIDIVEAVGGIEVDVTDAEAKEMKAPMGEQNKYLGYEKGTDYLKSGSDNLLLNGNQALAYARIRHNVGDDYARTERQRRVITKVIEKSKNLSLSQIDKLVTKQLQEDQNVKSDLETGDIASLLLNVFEYMDYEVQEVRVPADGTFTDENYNGMQVFSVDFTSNAKLVQETIYGSSLIDNDVGNSTIDAGYDQNGNFVGDNGYYDKDGNYVGAGGYYDDYGNYITY